MTFTVDFNIGNVIASLVSFLVGIIVMLLRKDFRILTGTINKLSDAVKKLSDAQLIISEKFEGHEKIADFKYNELNGRIKNIEGTQ